MVKWNFALVSLLCLQVETEIENSKYQVFKIEERGERDIESTSSKSGAGGRKSAW